jgi:propanol-preferring alcohol dehydrogenase
VYTDIHAARGDWPVKPAAPFTPAADHVINAAETDPAAATQALGARSSAPAKADG